MTQAIVKCTKCNYEAFRLEYELLGDRCSRCDGLVKILAQSKEKTQ